MDSVRSKSALDRATPETLWNWAIFLGLVGGAMRALWFYKYETEIPFRFGSTLSGHAWALAPQFRAVIPPGALDSYELTRAFAPGYGAMLRGLVEAAGGSSASFHTVGLALLAAQSAMVFAATLFTYALARRVLFGWASLVPVVFIVLSISLQELAGGLAPSIPTMLLLVMAVWTLVLVREHGARGRGKADVALTIASGFLFGAAVLFCPAVLVVVPFVLWWAFRGIGREHATLLLVATVLLPACWLAVAQAELPGGIPTASATSWFDTGAGKIPDSPTAALDRAYWVVTPWNARWARGAYASRNWNYGWIIPIKTRENPTYQSATNGLIKFFTVIYVLLIVLGLIELFAEGAGSGARLIAIPAVTLPFATFLTPVGNLLRVPILPFLMIAAALGLVWLLENLKPYIRDRRALNRAGWT